jgi:transposase-like protein
MSALAYLRGGLSVIPCSPRSKRPHLPALEAAKGTQTLSELASEYQLHPSQISEWKRALLDVGPDFSTRRAREKRAQATREAELYEQIGRLKMELEWLKKSYRTRLRVSV